MRAANLAMRFFLELAMLVGLALDGWAIGGVIVGIAAPIIAIVLWAVLLAPKAARRLSDPAKLALEIVLFVAATIGFFAAGVPMVAMVFAALVALNLILMFAWDQRDR